MPYCRGRVTCHEQRKARAYCACRRLQLGRAPDGAVGIRASASASAVVRTPSAASSRSMLIEMSAGALTPRQTLAAGAGWMAAGLLPHVAATVRAMSTRLSRAGPPMFNTLRVPVHGLPRRAHVHIARSPAGTGGCRPPVLQGLTFARNEHAHDRLHTPAAP